MPFLGEKLRYKRMAVGLSLKEAAKKARIKKKHVEALEKEEVLMFRDKKTVIENLEKYSSALNLDRDEIMEEFEYLWSDSSTAKAYLQKKYSRGGGGLFNRDFRMLAYGAAALFAALFLSVGGYMVWGSLGEQIELAGLIASPAEEVEEQAPVSPEQEENCLETPMRTAQNEAGQNSEEEIDSPAETDEITETDEVTETDEMTETDEIAEAEKKDHITEFVEMDVSVPRTDGDMNLLYTGLYFIGSGIILLFGLNYFNPASGKKITR